MGIFATLEIHCMAVKNPVPGFANYEGRRLSWPRCVFDEDADITGFGASIQLVVDRASSKVPIVAAYGCK